ncbi:unnamed protein product [Adineta ricciae]|uniref:Uncharacterized protein n=1 Tax=Adineta ricciae TaxID=249248 RepID=A0A814PHK4_ADIRI|nr:unnamed protein product [Adineta ricciae]CAF1106807.1 unnamed protein product [Adineta ricciae]
MYSDEDEKNESIAKKSTKPLVPPKRTLGLWKTCCAGIIMGFVAYNGSFSIVPVVYTSCSLIFGSKSWFTILATACGQLTAGYLHTHSSRTGMALSIQFFQGFYISKSEMRNRRKYNETRCQSLRRFFITHPVNAFVLSGMWQTFTMFYILQTELYLAYFDSVNISKVGGANAVCSSEERILIIQGLTRYVAGCVSGMSTGMINHLWQRYLAHRPEHHAESIDTKQQRLKLRWVDRRKLLSPCNMENWIKVSVMLFGALFIVVSNIPNSTGLHLLTLRQKRIITDILVINGGWFYFRDAAMLFLKKAEKPPRIPLNLVDSTLSATNSKLLENGQSEC